jgi:hypothetical protein
VRSNSRRTRKTGRNFNTEAAGIAARAIADDSVRDFDHARRYAQDVLGRDAKQAEPSNLEIHRALIEHLSLFEYDNQLERVSRLRRVAQRAMEMLADFNPRLCGPVWSGTATEATPIALHLISDETEAVTRFLLGRRIDYELVEAWFSFPKDRTPRPLPQFEVMLGGEAFDLSVFPERGAWHHPLSALDGRPVKRVSLSTLTGTIESAILFPDSTTAAI